MITNLSGGGGEAVKHRWFLYLPTVVPPFLESEPATIPQERKRIKWATKLDIITKEGLNGFNPSAVNRSKI